MDILELIITCDGGSLGNGTKESVGYGSYMINPPEKVGKIFSLNFGKGITNNEAEYRSLLGALTHIEEAFTAVSTDLSTINLTIRTDSQLVISQLTREWNVKSKTLLPLVVEVENNINKFGVVRFEKISGDQMKTILGH